MIKDTIVPMELIKELGRRIQKARKEKGLTQQELADLSHVSLKHVQGCERGVKNPSFEVLRAFCKVLNLSLDSLMNLDLPEDEQAANDMRQLYLSCPPAARKVLLNSTRALTDELKEMVQTAGVDPDEHLENMVSLNRRTTLVLPQKLRNFRSQSALTADQMM